MACISLKLIYILRQQILDGESVRNLATRYKISESTVRAYTKAERARLKKEVANAL